MSVGLLLITHVGVAKNLLDTADRMLGSYTTKIKTIEVPLDAETESISNQARQLLEELNQGHGILILTDLYGSTPSNIACNLITTPDIQLVAGINLPMLVRTLNYPDLTLDELVNKAISGGKDGILQCTCKTTT
ncbi:MAG: PTS sugar transporter subunit IIA [Gammaproteobacteria bacterium]|nr:PTS sugar transporter subunit IIA [Gammaproteobacteria bacterium]